MRIEVKGLDALIKRVNRLATDSKADIQAALNAFSDAAATDAISLAPADESQLRKSIKPYYGNLEGGVVANVNYAAYIEFGTRKFAAEYVPTLPDDWQKIARSKSGSSGSTGNFFENIRAWVKRKGIVSRYSVKTKKEIKRYTDDDNKRLDAAAKAIMWHILKNGIKPHPFMYPAIYKNRGKLFKELKAIFK